MSFDNKNFTQGGQVVFYMISMFLQINKIIFKYLSIFFCVLTIFIFFFLNVARFNAIKMGYYYYIAKMSSFGFNGHITINLGERSFSARASEIYNNQEFIKAGQFLLNQIYISAISSFVICLFIAITVYYYLGYKGKKQSDDEYISGRTFEKNYKKVAKQLQKEKIASDIEISGLPILKNSEIQNILLHGTVGSGKSTVINQYIQQIIIRSLIAKGDKVIIYDRGNSFLPKFFDENKDYILNPLDARCAKWSLWEECKTKPEFDMFASSLIPEQQGGSDPFWINAPRTIISSVGYEMRNNNPSYNKYLQYLLNVDLPTMRKLLKGTESENLVDGKAEKTTSSIRNVITTYAKSLTYMQGLETTSDKSFTIKNWITDPNDKGVLYITSNGSQHESIKSLITAWLSIAINSLFQLGEDRNRRVWFVLDELYSLNKLPILGSMLAEGRKFGSCFLIGLQNLAQLEDLYGVKGAASLLDLINTRYFFRSPSYDVAKRVSEQIGKTKYDVFSEQYAYGKSDVRDGVSFNKKEEEREIVSPYDIMQLPDLTCYVTYPAQVPVTVLKLKYKEYESKVKGFIPRIIEESILSEEKKSSKSSTTNDNGQEVSFSELQSTSNTTEKEHSQKLDERVKVNSEREIANRDEVNINESNEHINHEYQL
ncbi:type IV conjugative transfer system coupling protein TraD [Gilliamella sp. BG7]|uniref:type IV conjugative transfer system coupling protein TraD n=1 Tax=unclassified Gilliamella TaxID=2685620 RepID=UPI0039878F26